MTQDLHYLLCSVGEVFLDLLIRKFEHLKSICVGCLSCLCFSKIVNNAAIGESLLDVLIGEKDYEIAVRVSLPSHTVCEDDFLLAGLVDSLNFAVLANNLLNNLLVLTSLLVIFI